MSAGQIALVMAALFMIGVGAYLRFVEGEDTGTVFIACGATFAAVSAAMVGAAANKKRQEDDAQ